MRSLCDWISLDLMCKPVMWACYVIGIDWFVSFLGSLLCKCRHIAEKWAYCELMQICKKQASHTSSSGLTLYNLVWFDSITWFNLANTDLSYLLCGSGTSQLLPFFLYDCTVNKCWITEISFKMYEDQCLQSQLVTLFLMESSLTLWFGGVFIFLPNVLCRKTYAAR